MAQIGLQYLICSPLSETATTVEYADGRIMSKAIKADLSIEINEATLYGDNAIAENIKEFKSGKLTLNGDHIEYDTLALILGHTLENLTGNNQKLIAKGDDDGQFVGIGFYATTIKGGVRRYRAIWLKKIKFGIPNESLETKDDAINFQTPTVEGTILTDVTGTWKEECTFSNESDAKNWLDMIANMKLQVNPVKATPPQGTYIGTQSVVLSCGTDTATIKYSKDGSEPSLAYSTPISVTATTVLKTKAVKSGLIDSVTKTEVYIINGGA